MKKFIFFIIATLLISKSFSQVNLSSGLVAFYPFNGNANDASGNGNNAIFNNATLTSDRLGNPNSAYYFNGIDNYIQIPNSSSLVPQELSLCAIVTPLGFYTGPCYNSCIIDKGSPDYIPGDYSLRFTQAAYTSANCNTFDTLHQDFVGYSYLNNSAPLYTPYVTYNTSYCLVYTVSADSLKLYVDGALVWKEQKTYAIGINSQDLFLGRKNDGQYPFWFHGIMDEVRIYNRAINDQEVKALCTDTITTNVTAGFTAPDTVCVNSPVTIQNTSVGATNYYWNFCTANINQPPTGTNLGNVGGLLSAPVYMDYVFTNGNYYGFVTNNSPGGLLRLDFGNSLLNTPTVTNLGNIGGVIPNNTEGVQIANDNGNWYVLIVGGDAGAGSTPSLTTVSLGANIANNSPTATNWGNIGNLSYPHDLYVFNDKGSWYGLTVNYSNSTITLFNLTTSLSNTPTATNLGNIGNLSGPTGIQAINDNGNWRVFVTNATSSTLTRLDFGSSLLNIPTGVNLGNPNNAFVTCWDIYVLKYCGENEAYVINANSPDDIVKLDFGSSLLNTPSAVSLGNQGNLNFPHSISKLFRVGADVFSFVTNVNNNTLSLLDFTGCTNASIPNSTAQNPPPITYNTPGIYNINLTVDDGLPTQTSYCKQVVVKDCSCHDSVTIKDSATTCSSFNFSGTVYTNTAAINSWQWSFGDGGTATTQNTSHTYLNGGTFTTKLVVTDVNGCKDSISKSVITSTLNITKSNDTTLCGKTSIQLSAGGGVSYAWTPIASLNNPGISNPVANPSTTTVYRVTITNALGCTKTDSIKITIDSLPVILKSNDTSVCINSSVQLYAGGGYAYLWTPAASLNNSNISNPVATPLVNTTYFVKVTTSSGCSKIDSIKITTKNLPLISISNDTNICINSSTQLSASGGFSYAWTPTSTLNNPGVSNPVARPVATTTYHVTVSNSIGCSKTDSIKITVNSLPLIIKSKDAGICNNASIQLSASGGSSYSWAPVATLSDPNISNPVATPSATTLYYIIVTDANGCSNKDSIKITTSAPPVITKSKDTSICKNTSAQIFATGGTTYTWSPASTLSNAGIFNPIASPNISTTYYVIVTNAYGCSKNDSVKVMISPPPVISKSNDTSICMNSSIQLSASGGLSYSWSPASTLNNPDVNDPVATPLATTKYYVTVTNAVGCSQTDSIKISINSLPSITKSKDAGICNNASVQLSTGGGSSYSWTPTATLNNPSISNPIATPSVTTLYYVTVTNANGCSKEDSIKITTSSPPVITKSKDTGICKNTSVQIFANGGSAYAWSPVASLSNSTISDPVARPNTSTTYYVTVTNAYGCSKNDSVKVAINPLPIITISKDTSVCNKSSIKLFVAGGASYLWSPALSLDNPTSSTPVATPSIATVYKVVIIDPYSCTYQDSVKVGIKSIAKFSISPDASVCATTPKQLLAMGGDSYVWSPSTGLNNPNINNPIATPVATTTYTVVIHENACNETATLSTTLNELTLPAINASSSNDITCSVSSSQLTATGATNYTWSPANGLNNSNISNPVAAPTSTTLYTVIGKGDNGCTNSDTVTVNADYSMKSLYLMANAFTPNGDGINDCFGVKYWGVIQELDFSIYNRYGERVFHTNDPNKCWDGTYKQHLQDVNVFVYLIKAKTACGYVERKGTLSLLK